ncbi:hypothetical protein, partial [Holdemania sp. 1001302B_160321_E10]|uniref:hypothetical protein n=1 Tax=Holdemania sp. 1001302B_160321_E10 TaxID=2787120 RepID=UPI001E4A381A
REIQDDYNSFARVNAVRVFAKVNAIPFSLKAAFTFSIHFLEKHSSNRSEKVAFFGWFGYNISACIRREGKYAKSCLKRERSIG